MVKQSSPLTPSGVDGQQVPEPPEPQAFAVRGEVVRPDGTPLPNLPVRALDRTVCQWRSLGDGRTDDLGRYVIEYDRALLTQWGKQRADLKVEVLDPKQDRVLAESPLILRALPRETVNLTVGDGRYRGPDEYTRVERVVSGSLPADVDLTCLGPADVLILARQTEVASSKLAYYVKARRWSTEYGLPAAVFYGLLRRGEPTRLDALLARPLVRLWATLTEATERGIVAVPLTAAIRNRLARLQQDYLARPEHPYGILLRTTTLTGEQQSVFTRRLTTGTDTGEALWQALLTEDGLGPEQVDELRATFELQALVGDNTSLTVRLRGELGVRAPREVAAFRVEHWRDTVLASSTVDIPDDVRPEGTDAERRAAYARMLYRVAESRYPTASLAGQLARDPGWADTRLLRFFAANPEFEFRDQRVLTVLRERPDLLAGQPAAVRDDLLRLEQLFHLVPDEDKLAAIQPLWDAGLRSAPQIAYLGRGNLSRRVGPRLDARIVHRVYRAAMHVTALALQVYLRYHPGLNQPSTRALRAPAVSDALPTGQALARTAVVMPEWEELFGSADTCACTPSDSALSPAAYLVDIMAFLERAVDDAGNNALDELLARRPDLVMLRLTAANTDTPLPHIDLVNEILEAIVASADGRTLPGAAIGETTWDSDLLAAQPEHLQPAAYEVLRNSRYPFDHLPFHLWAEEGRRYLSQMGVARDELMRVMPARPGVGAVQIATEALGMSAAERDLICRPRSAPAPLALAWGFAQPADLAAAQLAVVANLLARAHLDYETLLRLLNTRYLNPDRRVSVRFAAESCSLDDAVLVDEHGDRLSGERLRSFLDRLHRCLRLRRRLGCDEYDLDTLIRALGVTDFDAEGLLPNLAAAQALHRELDVSWPELAAWWADLDTYRFDDEIPAQYETVFLDVALFPDTHDGTGPDLRKTVFALRPDRADLAVTVSIDPNLVPWLAESDGAVPATYTLRPEYAGYVASATQLTAEDLLLLARDLLPKDPGTGHVALNLANLSSLYRVASLARALALSVRDTLRLAALTGIAPLHTAAATATPADSLRYQQAVDEIRSGAHSVAELAYLLRHEAEAVVELAPSTDAAAAWLASVAPTFAGIVAVDDARITGELTSAVTQSLGATLGTDPEVLSALLFTHRPESGAELLAHLIVAGNTGASDLPAPDLPAPGRDFGTVFGQVHKFGVAWNGLALAPAALPFVLDRGPALGWTDLAALPMTASDAVPLDPWRRIATAAELQASTFTGEQSLFGLLEDVAAQAGDPAASVPGELLSQVSAATGWPLADLTYLTGPAGFGYQLPAAMRDERALVELRRVLDLVTPTGVAAEQVHAWADAELTYGQTQSIRQALSLAYPSDRWLDVLGAIQDELRTLRRDALLGHVLTTLGLPDRDAFYRHFLVDPDESPVDRTSRIVLAHSAVQLFAQRILLNLEPFRFERADAESWQWRKRYRVWEAARKVFLWPENWLEPELRDDKSAFFTTLEEGLLQTDVTHEAAEQLYRQYLHEVHEVSQLSITGLYVADETAEQGSTLHVFGRTRAVPRRYFYRRRHNGSQWTPWEPVGLDITADHLIPVVNDGRLYLFWPEFTQSENPDRVSTRTEQFEVDPERCDEVRAEIAEHRKRIDEIDKALADGLAENPNFKGDLEAERESHEDAIAQLETELDTLTQDRATVVLGDRYAMTVTLKWSEYRGDRWLAPTAAQNGISYTTSDPATRHYFTGWVDTDGVLRISARINKAGNGEGVDDPHSAEGYLGYFSFDKCGGSLVATSVQVTDPAGEVDVSKAQPDAHSAVWYDTWWSSDSLELQVGDPPQRRRLLTAAGHLYYAHQYGQFGTATSPFFFADEARTYFVEPVRPSWPLATGLPPRAAHLRAGTSRRRRYTSDTAASRIGATVSSTVAGPHFDASDTDLIVDRGASALTASTSVRDLGTLSGTLGSLIEADAEPVILAGTETIGPPTQTRYRFTAFYHPHTCRFLEQFSRYGVDGLLNPDPDQDPDSAELYRQLLPSHTFDFADTYQTDPVWVAPPARGQLDEQIDFGFWSPHGPYNWELFFHIPFLVATRLMQNQRYADARRWLHYIFDPTCTDGSGAERFWKIKPFYQEQLDGPLESLRQLLESGDSEYEQQVAQWELDPFNPHAIARLRVPAYMRAVVMRYLTCLIEEADRLFGRDTREDVNEARQLYLLAAEILGERPDAVPASEDATSTPNALLDRLRLDWAAPGRHPLDLLTALLPAPLAGVPTARMGTRTARAGSQTVDAAQPGSGNGSGPPHLPTVAGSPGAATGGIDTLLLFCLPPNDNLLGFWHTVEDRLFKIRNSMTLSGQLRQLALYAPPIDPALLVRAAAAGLTIEALLTSVYTPPSHYRFSFLLQRALDLCGEVRALGGALVAALERRDGEQVGLLRSSHEVSLLELVRATRTKRLQEAEAALAGLVKSREAAQLRVDYYAGLERISVGEQNSLDALDAGRAHQRHAETVEALANIANLIPNVAVSTTSVSYSFGGSNLGAALQSVASGSRARANATSYESGRYATVAGYTRRFRDWKLQADLARKEIEQLDQQILAAEIRRELAGTELANHDKQLAQAREVEEFLRHKFTSQELYGWMVGRLSAVHFQAYQLAYQLAVRAEAAFRRELGPEQATATFVRPDNWDSLRSGLHAGELLYQQLRQMDIAYLAVNERELEITKPVSLFHLDPAALLTLRRTGSCQFSIPELPFDMDFPGHYHRRIKAVRVSIPCVVGPYASVSATLRLLESHTRRGTDRSDPQQPERDLVAPAQSAIAVSGANQDGGVFELSFGDPRYLPFEGAGAISRWQLDLPSTVRPFDYATISDVVIHLSYTAREAGADFADQVRAELPAALSATPMGRLFSLRHDQPNAWYQLSSGQTETRTCTLRLTRAHFPASLDQVWEIAEDGTPQLTPVTLAVTRLVGYLSPKGPLPVSADGIVVNGQSGTESGLGMPAFELTEAPGALSGREIDETGVIDCTLTVEGLDDLEEWSDLYLTLEYRVTV